MPTPAKLVRRLQTISCQFRITVTLHRLSLKRNDSRSAGLFDLSKNGAPALIASIRKRGVLQAETRAMQWNIEGRDCLWEETISFDCTLFRYKSGRIADKKYKIFVLDPRRKKVASFETNVSFLGATDFRGPKKLDLPNHEGYTLQVSFDAASLDSWKSDLRDSSMSTPHSAVKSIGGSSSGGRGTGSGCAATTTTATATAATPAKLSEVYKIIWPGGVAVRQGIELDSPIVCKLQQHDEVVVLARQRNSRGVDRLQVRIPRSMNSGIKEGKDSGCGGSNRIGWLSARASKGDRPMLIERVRYGDEHTSPTVAAEAATSWAFTNHGDKEGEEKEEQRDETGVVRAVSSTNPFGKLSVSGGSSSSAEMGTPTAARAAAADESALTIPNASAGTGAGAGTAGSGPGASSFEQQVAALQTQLAESRAAHRTDLERLVHQQKEAAAARAERERGRKAKRKAVQAERLRRALMQAEARHEQELRRAVTTRGEVAAAEMEMLQLRLEQVYGSGGKNQTSRSSRSSNNTSDGSSSSSRESWDVEQTLVLEAALKCVEETRHQSQEAVGAAARLFSSDDAAKAAALVHFAGAGAGQAPAIQGVAAAERRHRRRLAEAEAGRADAEGRAATAELRVKALQKERQQRQEQEQGQGRSEALEAIREGSVKEEEDDDEDDEDEDASRVQMELARRAEGVKRLWASMQRQLEYNDGSSCKGGGSGEGQGGQEGPEEAFADSGEGRRQFENVVDAVLLTPVDVHSSYRSVSDSDSGCNSGSGSDSDSSEDAKRRANKVAEDGAGAHLHRYLHAVCRQREEDLMGEAIAAKLALVEAQMALDTAEGAAAAERRAAQALREERDELQRQVGMTGMNDDLEAGNGKGQLRTPTGPVHPQRSQTDPKRKYKKSKSWWS